MEPLQARTRLERLAAFASKIIEIKNVGQAERIYDIVLKENGYLADAGAVNLASADDLIVQIERPEPDPH